MSRSNSRPCIRVEMQASTMGGAAQIGFATRKAALEMGLRSLVHKATRALPIPQSSPDIAGM
jgi:hypothetical protein